MKTTYSCNVWTVAENAKVVSLYFGMGAYKRAHGKYPHKMQGAIVAATLETINKVSPVVRKSLDMKLQNITAILEMLGRSDLVCPGFKSRSHTQIDNKARGDDPMLWAQVQAAILDADAGLIVERVQA